MRYILGIILLVSTAYSKAGDIIDYRIDGKLQDTATVGFAYLYIPATSLQPSLLISAPIDNNRFVIRGSINQLAGRYSIARLFISPKAGMKLGEHNSLFQQGKLQYTELILEERVTITIGPGKEVSSIKGGELNDEYNVIQDILSGGLRRNDSLRNWYRQASIKSKKNRPEVQRIQETYYSLLTEQQDRQTSELLHFISANPSSILALDRLDLMASLKETAWRKFIRDFEQIFSVVPEKWLQSSKVKVLFQKISMIKASQQLVNGAILPNYVFRDGRDSVAILDFRGKYLLLQFWTSWSKNCREVQNDLVDAFHDYKNKGLTILQISLDANMENWKKALPKDGVAWKQVRCKTGWDPQVEKTFEIYSVPTNYLVDQDGKIISSNLWGKRLKDTLIELMH